ncbi:serine hydrolase FSH [Aspergillus nidulans var. acristatus]
MPALDIASAPAAAHHQQQLHLPRILCLHGGGTNAQIFTAQYRALRRHLADSYRLVFADAPFLSSAGPDVTSVYGEWGPFRSWVPVPAGVDTSAWAAASASSRIDVDVEAIDECIAAAMEQDDRAGGTGDWVGLLGFSQGARIAASLLYRQQRQQRMGLTSWGRGRDRKRGVTAGTSYRFAVVLAGRGPLLDLGFGSGSLTGSSAASASASASASGSESASEEEEDGHLLSIPTIHVHGLRDPGLEMHRDLVRSCRPSSVRIVEWEGAHRMPIATKDVGAVVAEIRQLAISRKYESLRC